MKLSMRYRRGWGSAAKQIVSKSEGANEAVIECETFSRLEEFMGSDKFLEKLQTPIDATPRGTQAQTDVAEIISDAMATDITSSPASTPTTLDEDAEATETDPTSSSHEDFVVIDRQGAIEAMAFHIAETLMKYPQASALPPAKLQEAIIVGIQIMKQAKFKKICAVGWHAYRWSAVCYSAFQVYSNPWIIQAIIQAIFGFSRMTLRVWI